MSTSVRMPRHAPAGALTFAAALAITLSCGSPSGQGNGCQSTGADVIINAQDNQTFDKPNLTITRGQRVCWQNNGSLTHTVTPTSSSPLDSNWTAAKFDATLAPNSVAIHTFSTVGQYLYRCVFHAGMTGTINAQ
jgi:plastocyanin